MKEPFLELPSGDNHHVANIVGYGPRRAQNHLSENLVLPEGTKLLVTVLSDDEHQFWSGASESSLTAIWDNAEDDAYAQLLEE